MPGRKRKLFIPPSWVDPTSDNEWQVSSIPAIMDMGSTSQDQGQGGRESPKRQRVQLMGGVCEDLVEISEADDPMELDSNNDIESHQRFKQQPNLQAEPPQLLGDEPNEHRDRVNELLEQEPAVDRSLEEEIEIPRDRVNELLEQEDAVHSLLEEGFEQEEQVEEEEDQEDEEVREDEDEAERVAAEQERQDDYTEHIPNFEYIDFHDFQKDLAEKWVLLEISHRVSKTASNELWRLANSGFKKLFELKKQQKVVKKVPQFAQLRRCLYRDNVPPVSLEVAYRNKETDQVVVLKNLEKDPPVSQYPPDKFTKLYESATVKTADILAIHASKCPNIAPKKEIQLSCDSVSECRSNVVSLDVYSFKMLNCRQVYPLKIIRQIDKKAIDHREQLRLIIEDLLESDCKIAHYLADNLKRAIAKDCLNHASLFPCEYCFAKGGRIETVKMSIDKDKNRIQLSLINAKINELSGSNTNELKTLKIIQKELEVATKKENSKKSHIVWPSTSMDQEPRTSQTVLQIAIRIENGENLTADEKKGVVRKSPLHDIPRFNFVLNVPVDYMHALCIGAGKRLIELTFNIGEIRPRITKRKLSSTSTFNMLMMETKVPHEFPRRCRELLFSVMKATEYRNIIIFFFPYVLQCLEPAAKERKLWLYLAYMVRACVLPQKEFQPIPLSNIEECRKKYYFLYEELFGAANCTYNTHVVFSHIIEMRWHGPLTLTSTFPFENFYGEIRHSFVPGTQSPLKQMFKKILLKRTLENHSCSNKMYFSDHDTALECNTLIYTFVDLQHIMYKVIEHDKTSLKCHRIKVTRATFNEINRNFDWSQIGVYKESSMEQSVVNVQKSHVKGKVIRVGEHLFTCPKSILDEK